MFDYFAKLLQNSNFKPTLIPVLNLFIHSFIVFFLKKLVFLQKVANVINKANEAFFTSVRENKIKFAEVFF